MGLVHACTVLLVLLPAACAQLAPPLMLQLANWPGNAFRPISPMSYMMPWMGFNQMMPHPMIQHPLQFLGSASRPVAPSMGSAPHTPPKISSEDVHSAELVLGLPNDFDPADDVFGTLPKMPPNLNPVEKIKWAVLAEKQKRNRKKPAVEQARDVLYTAINQVNALNTFEPYTKLVGPIVESKLGGGAGGGGGGGGGDGGGASGNGLDFVTPPSASGDGKIFGVIPDFRKYLKLPTMDQAGRYGFSGQNFRSVYWLYPFLALSFAFLHPSAHAFGYLPWTFYFANLAAKTLTWDNKALGKAITM